MTENQAKELIRDGVLKGMCQYHVICFDANIAYWRRSAYYFIGMLVWFVGLGAFTAIAASSGSAIAYVLGTAWLLGTLYWLYMFCVKPIRMYRGDFIKAAKAKSLDVK